MSIFKDKVLLITGGTGSFGNAVLKRFLDSDVKEIRIFSRDEKKQDEMRHRLNNSKLNGRCRLCILGRGAQTGAFLRVLSDPGRTNEYFGF